MFSSPHCRRTPFSTRHQLLALFVILSLFYTIIPLPKFGSVASAQGAATISLAALGTAYTQNFDTLASTGTSSTLPAGWFFSESGTSANTTYTAGTGSSTTGDTYSFGSSGSTERALGGLQTGTLIPAFGASFTNNTGSTINELTISYTGEQWRLGTANRGADRIDFQLSTNATSLTTGTYTDFDNLDFSSPNTTTTGALDGNAAANRTNISATIRGFIVPSGSTFFIRWNDFNASGSDDGLAVDDFSIVATQTSPSGTGTATPSTVATGSSTLLTVNVTPGGNPASTGLAVTGDLRPIGGSATQQFYDDGTNGDATANDNIFSYSATVQANTTLGNKSLPITINDAESRTGSLNISLTVQQAAVAIHDIQGSGSMSPLAGQTVATTGIVTGVRNNGFFIETPDAQQDSDPNTSEGIFVFTSSAPPSGVALGNSVRVTGAVQEFRPNINGTPVTEISGSPTVTLLTTGNSLPTPVIIAASDFANTVGDRSVTPNLNLEPLEKYEGMRVRVARLTAIAPTRGNSVNEANATGSNANTVYGVVEGVARPFREIGLEIYAALPVGAPANIPRFDENQERVTLDTAALPAPLEVTTGATILEAIGPLDYSFDAYTIRVDAPSVTPAPTVTGLASFTAVPTPSPNELTISSFNMERFFDTTDDPSVDDVVLTQTAFDNRLNKASLAIRNVLLTPDVLGVEEMENLSTLQAVATKVNNDAVAANQPNPNYQAYLVEGNDIGGIDVGFLVKASRVSVVDVTQLELSGCDKTATRCNSYTDPNTGSPALLNDRPPLVLRATIQQPNSLPLAFTVIVVHQRSLSSIADATDGNRVRNKRRAQSEFLANYIQSRQTADPSENLITVGDFNAYQFSDGYVDVIGTVKGTPTPPDQVTLASSDLVNPDLTDLIDTLPAAQRYSYTFDGNAQAIDHALANNNFFSLLSRFAYARLDADFPETFRNDANRPERISDHDPEVAYFTLSATVPSPAATTNAATNVTASSATLNGTVNANNGGAVTVQFQYSTNADLSNATTIAATPGSVSGATDTAVSANIAGLAPGTLYYFRVVATNSANSATNGVILSFTTSAATPTPTPTPVQTPTPSPSPTTAPAFTSSAPPNGTVGTPYQFQFTASGNPQPTFSLTSGSLPPGLTLSSSGLLSGTPTTPGTYANITITASNGTAPNATQTVTIIIISGGMIAFSAATYSVSESATTATITVTRTGSAAGATSAQYATSNGTATAGSDYTATSGTISFADGEQGSKTFTVPIINDTASEPSETVNLTLSNVTGSATLGSQSTAVLTILDDDAPTVQFNQAAYSVAEADGSVQISLSRSGDASAVSSVDYATSDGTAKQKSDYIIQMGTLSFAAGERTKTFAVLVSPDSYVEGTENFTLALSNPQGASLGAQSTAIVTVLDSTTDPTRNVIDDARNFVHQQYQDFLNREPDAGGIAFWTQAITQCGSDQNCINRQRISVSAAFFIEKEYQDTGYFAYRLYKATFGRAPTFLEYTKARSQVVAGQTLTASKVTLTEELSKSPEVRALYDGKSNEEYVSAAFANTGIVPADAERQALVVGLNSGTETRVSVLIKIADTQAFIDQEFNAAFVTIQYFGYLRRDPDPGGFQFWLDILNNRQPNNFRGMVCAFANSREYQERFGAVVTHDDKNCGQ